MKISLKPALASIFLSAAVAFLISHFFGYYFFSSMLFVMAGLFVNGTIALWEDDMPGGFGNPDGAAPENMKRWGKLRFWVLSAIITAALIGAGAFLAAHKL
jgi:hypothetical protein